MVCLPPNPILFHLFFSYPPNPLPPAALRLFLESLMVCLPPNPILFHSFFSYPLKPPCCISTSSYQGDHMTVVFFRLTYFAKHDTL